MHSVFSGSIWCVKDTVRLNKLYSICHVNIGMSPLGLLQALPGRTLCANQGKEVYTDVLCLSCPQQDERQRAATAARKKKINIYAALSEVCEHHNGAQKKFVKLAIVFRCFGRG